MARVPEPEVREEMRWEFFAGSAAPSVVSWPASSGCSAAYYRAWAACCGDSSERAALTGSQWTLWHVDVVELRYSGDRPADQVTTFCSCQVCGSTPAGGPAAPKRCRQLLIVAAGTPVRFAASAAPCSSANLSASAFTVASVAAAASRRRPVVNADERSHEEHGLARSSLAVMHSEEPRGSPGALATFPPQRCGCVATPTARLIPP
jgi:hypothetical protein